MKKAPKVLYGVILGPNTDPRNIGYARVSTDDQDLTMQVEALRKAGVRDVNLYTDKKSGKSMRRQGLEHALLDARPGDVLVVWKLDRLSRSMKDLIKISEHLASQKIELRSLHEQIDTTSPMGKFFFHLMAALAEFERSLIGFRTKKGMEEAKRRGQRFGPTAIFGKQHFPAAIKLLKSGMSAEAVGKRFGVTGQVVRVKILAATGKKLWTAKNRKPKQRE